MENVEQKWLMNLLREDMMSEKPKIELDQKLRKPTSQIQNLIVDFYETLKSVESPDGFDKFFENHDLKNYNRTNVFIDFLDELTKRLSLSVEVPNSNIDGWKEQKVQKTLFAIAERKMAENEATLNTIKSAIDEKYKDLISDEKINPEQINEQYDDMVEQTLNDIKNQLEVNKEVLKEQIKRVETGKTDMEKIVDDLNEVVFLGNDIWELLLYSTLSPYCPKIKINSIDTRSNLHLMLVGDISTAKSKTMRILERISPKADWFTKITEATLEGVGTRNGIEEGIIDKANNGSLLFMDLTENHISIIREVMDNDRLKIGKGGNEKEINLNMTIQVAENPKSDFFINEVNLREQINFTDGLLSRFDVMIPLTTTKQKNELLLDMINLFGDTKNKVDMESIGQILKTKAVGMRGVKEVVLTNEQKDMIKKIFLRHNIDLKNRPLLILRDYETLARLVNVVVVSNFFNRKLENGVIQADDKDIEKAITLWETLIDMRKTLYTQNDRINIITIEDKILKELTRLGGKVDCIVLEKSVVESGICSRATFYRNIERLNGRKITLNGNIDREVVML